MQNNDDVIEIDLKELFGLVIHWLWLIVLCGLLAGAVGFAISKFVITPQYASTTKVYILNRQNSDTLTYSDLQMGSQLTKDYAQLIKSRDVLEAVIRAATLNESYNSFASRVTVETLTDTRIIAITVTDDNPAMAQYLADEIRTIAADHIKNVMDIQAVNVAEMANLPTAPASPSVTKWTAIGFLLGAFLSAMIIIIQFLVDDTIKTSEDVERYLGLSTLAMIPTKEDESKKKRRKSGSSNSGANETISYEFNNENSGGRETR
ncbi:MAG: protein-tyrosine kinase [Lachnospiraceae bacterium]|nr:protein-tyrosine kinase [Lachnospiraceae bacterium]